MKIEGWRWEAGAGKDRTFLEIRAVQVREFSRYHYYTLGGAGARTDGAQRRQGMIFAGVFGGRVEG